MHVRVKESVARIEEREEAARVPEEEEDEKSVFMVQMDVKTA